MNHLEFKRLLSLHGLTQARTAELCHVCPRTVAYWLSGGRTIPAWAPEFIALKLANPVGDTDFGPIKKEMDAAIKSLGGTSAASDFVRTQAITYLHAKRTPGYLATYEDEMSE